MADVRVSGPFFDGRADAALQDFLREVPYTVASQGLAYWQTNLDASIKHPTPYYETQVHVYRDGDAAVVDDRGIIYGPWLEGVGSRNSPVTRFPGYHSLRKAVQTLSGRTREIAERTLAKYIGRMN
jgi:hypothetical protein